MNQFFNNVATTVDKNLPTILTCANVGIGLATVGYTIWGTMQMTRELEELPEDAGKGDAALVVAKYMWPTVVGVSAASACAIGANHIHGVRYAALGAGLVATQIDKDAVKAKLDDILDRSPVEVVEENENVQVPAQITTSRDPWKKCWFHDTETGMIFETTLTKFWEEVYRFNDLCGSDRYDIVEFYRMLLGNDYKPAGVHESVVFGHGCSVPSLSPKLDGEISDDMQLVYKVSYRYSTGEDIDYNELH